MGEHVYDPYKRTVFGFRVLTCLVNHIEFGLAGQSPEPDTITQFVNPTE